MPRLAALLLVFAVAVSSAEASVPQSTAAPADNGATTEAVKNAAAPARADTAEADPRPAAPKPQAKAGVGPNTSAEQPQDGSRKRLVPFYISFATLQALDVHSTLRALDRGAAEGNVLMQPFASRPAAFIALKAGVTAGLLFANERLGRRHRVAALALMVAANGMYAAIVAHNYRVAAR
jgi:hypothetical protein